MQQESERKRLSGRVKLVGAVLLAAIGAMVMFAQMASKKKKSAATEVLTAAADTTILVHLDEAKTYSEANEFCSAEYGTHLAVIEDSTANQRLFEMLEIYGVSAWIGFADLQNADDFQWVDASPDAYTNWDEGEPTDLCVQMLAASGKWEDVHCSETKAAFFCEALADASATATAQVRVDNAQIYKLAAAATSAEANAHCQSQGEDLYSVIDAVDNARIQTALKAAAVDFAWFGLKTASQSYAWMDGRALDFSMWATDEPKENHFSQMRASDGQWMTACVDATVFGVICAATGGTPEPVPMSTPFVATGSTPPPTELVRMEDFQLSTDNFLGQLYVLKNVMYNFEVTLNSPPTEMSQILRTQITFGYDGFPKLEVDLYMNLYLFWGTAEDGSLALCKSLTPAIVLGMGTQFHIFAGEDSGGKFVEVTIDGNLICRRDGEWLGQYTYNNVYMSDPVSVAADATVRDFHMMTFEQ